MKNIWYPSSNYDERQESIKAIVIHYTHCDFETAMGLLTRGGCENPVSCHYLIDENGDLYQLVAEDKRAWHAGPSFWRGLANLNHSSLGIELVNPGHGPFYRDFPEAQIQTLVKLCRNLINRYNILSPYITGHSDIVPLRKQDPGEKFPWHILAQNGIGLSPVTPFQLGEKEADLKDLQNALRNVGYGVDVNGEMDSLTRATLHSFSMHFMPWVLGQSPTTGDYFKGISCVEKQIKTVSQLP